MISETPYLMASKPATRVDFPEISCLLLIPFLILNTSFLL